VAGMNLGLLLRKAYGIGTPRGLQDLSIAVRFLVALIARIVSLENAQFLRLGVTAERSTTSYYQPHLCAHFGRSEITKQTSNPAC